MPQHSFIKDMFIQGLQFWLWIALAMSIVLLFMDLMGTLVFVPSYLMVVLPLLLIPPILIGYFINNNKGDA